MIHDVFWTGGWDSTFRVLDLAHSKQHVVQPHYIVDHQRKSTAFELAAMNNIRTSLKKMDSASAERIKPLIIADRRAIKRDKELNYHFIRLNSISHLGSQNEWLACYARQYELKSLEVATHIGDGVQALIKDYVIKVGSKDDYVFIVDPNAAEKSLSLFSRFVFPVLDLTKLNMFEFAQRNGIAELMELTWFCHFPIFNKPCGVCEPCKNVTAQGLGRRSKSPSMSDKLLYYIAKPAHKALGKFVGFVDKVGERN